MVTAKLKAAVYEVLKTSGKPTHLADIYGGVKEKVPDLCDDAVSPCPYCGQNHPKWKHDVQWALQVLKGKSLVEAASRGYWQAKPAPTPIALPSPVVHEPAAIGKPHEIFKSMIREIGETIGRVVNTEYSAAPYQYDVIWKEVESLPPSHVFEVQDKGSLDGALAKLQHARDLWRSRLFLVVTGEKDREKLELLLRPFWQGAFHKLRKDIIVILPVTLEEIHKAVTDHGQIIRAFIES